MRVENVKTRTLLVNDDGSIHGPYSLYLNMSFDNPHTRESVATGLRVLDKLIDAFKIDLALRALDGECLTEGEKQGLRQLAYRPIIEIERLSARLEVVREGRAH